MGRNKKNKNPPKRPPPRKKHSKLHNVLPKGKRNRKKRQQQHNELVNAFQSLAVEKPLTTEEKLDDIYAAIAAIKIPQETDLKIEDDL